MNTEKTKDNVDLHYSLSHMKPTKGNKEIQFPSHYPKGRMVVKEGIRYIDWDGECWKAFVKEGASWLQDELGDNDYRILSKCFKS
jgi:hypothetical protein